MTGAEFQADRVWVGLAEGGKSIGSFLNCGELGVEVYDVDDAFVGMFADEEAAEDAILDCWEVRENGGGTPASVPAPLEEEISSWGPPAEKKAPSPDVAQPEPEPLPDAFWPSTTPNLLHTQAFVLALFKHATAGSYVSLRTFPDKGGNSRPARITTVKLNGDLNDLIERAYREIEFAARSPEKLVFCPPVATFISGKNAKEANLSEGLVLSVECDQYPRAAQAKLEALLGPATLIVHSGGEWTNPETGEIEPKLHLYYLLKKPVTGEQLGKLKQARAFATKLVGGDASNVSIVHPIRWPGSVHRKGDPKLCHIVGLNPEIEIELNATLEILQQAVDEEPSRKNETSTYKPVGAGEIADRFKHLLFKSLATGLETSIEEIRSAAAAIPPEAVADEPNWMNLARALAWEAKGRPEKTEELWEILDTVSKKAPEKYNYEENREKFERYIREAGNHPDPITTRTLFDLAYEHGWQGWYGPAPDPNSDPAPAQKPAAEPKVVPRDLWAKFDPHRFRPNCYQHPSRNTHSHGQS